MPADGRFLAFFRRYPELSTWTGESVNSSSATLGEGFQKVVKIYLSLRVV